MTKIIAVGLKPNISEKVVDIPADWNIMASFSLFSRKNYNITIGVLVARMPAVGVSAADMPAVGVIVLETFYLIDLGRFCFLFAKIIAISLEPDIPKKVVDIQVDYYAIISFLFLHS